MKTKGGGGPCISQNSKLTFLLYASLFINNTSANYDALRNLEESKKTSIVVTKENGYTWPDTGPKITDSDRHNITVWYGDLGADSNVRTTFEYWTR